MPGEDGRQYEVEPSKAEPVGAAEAVTPLEKLLDRCPSCGAALGDVSNVVCLRCGYDLKAMKQLSTKTGVEEKPPPDAPAPALVSDRPRALWIPGVLAIAAAALMLFGLLVGVKGLFPRADAASIGVRLIEVLRFLVLAAVLGAAAMGALYGLAIPLGRRVGPWRSAAVRALAIVLVAQLVRFLGVAGRPALELWIELVLGAAAMYGLAMLLLRVTWREAGFWLGLLAGAVGLLLVFSHVVGWALAM